MRETISDLELADAQISMLQARVYTLTVALRSAITAMEAEQRVVHPSNREERESLIRALRAALERKAGGDA